MFETLVTYSIPKGLPKMDLLAGIGRLDFSRTETIDLSILFDLILKCSFAKTHESLAYFGNGNGDQFQSVDSPAHPTRFYQCVLIGLNTWV